MNHLKLNSWLTLAANIGVLKGIILLVFELQQNRELMRAQIRNELASELIGLFSDMAYSSEFASIATRSAGGEELNPTETFQYRVRSFALFRYFENVHYQYRQGLYDESEFENQKIAWQNALRSERITDIWCGYRDSISVEARAEIDKLLTYKKCEE